jgi:cytochrome c peroxidase
MNRMLATFVLASFVTLANATPLGLPEVPTVINSAYNMTQFWDGREPDLEGQSKQPPLNPVEIGLADYEPILKIVRSDPE